MDDYDDVTLPPAPIGNLGLLPARDGLVLTYRQPPAQVCFKSTAMVDQDIAAFGTMRAELLPPVPETWPGGLVHGVRRDPAWSIEGDALAGDVLIHIRDDRFGWLHTIHTRERARQFALAILAQLEEPPPVHGRA
jgi:hypothetical protein